MTNKSLRRLNLPEAIVDRLAAKNIKLCKGITLRDTHDMPNGRFLSTSLPKLDSVLHGGFPAGNISEVTGPAGSGKTQFCIMMSALTAMTSQGKEGGVIYFDTEGAFSGHRLYEIVQSRCPSFTRRSVDDIVSKVCLIPAMSCTELMNRMENLEEIIISKSGLLIIVDSVASLVRKEFQTTRLGIIERTNFITRLAAILKYTAQFFKIPVITTNQITTKVSHVHPGMSASEEYPYRPDLDSDEHGHLTAALGNTWSHSVNTRLILQYLTSDTRQILVAKSPVSPFAAVNYTIQACGLVQQGDDVVRYEGTDPGEQRIRSRSSVPQVSSQWSSM